MNILLIEKNIIEKMPAGLQEYVVSKFKPVISSYKPVELELRVGELIIRTLFEAGVKDQADPKVIDFLTQTLYKDIQHPKYSKISFEEIELALHKGVRREYGVYMGVNIQTIHSWIKAYLESKERENAIKDFNRIANEHEFGKDDRSSKVNPDGQKRLIEMLKPLAESKKPSYIHKEAKVIEKTERDLFIQKCFSEFFILWTKNAVPNSDGLNTRFIYFEGKEIDETEYLTIKLKELDLLKANQI